MKQREKNRGLYLLVKSFKLSKCRRRPAQGIVWSERNFLYAVRVVDGKCDFLRVGVRGAVGIHELDGKLNELLYANLLQLDTPGKILDGSFGMRPCTDSASLVNARGDLVTVAVYLDVFTPKSSHTIVANIESQLSLVSSILFC